MYYKLLKFFGALRYSTDISKAVNGRSKLIWEEAILRGIKMNQLVIFGKYMDYYRAKINEIFFYFESLPIPGKNLSQSSIGPIFFNILS